MCKFVLSIALRVKWSKLYQMCGGQRTVVDAFQVCSKRAIRYVASFRNQSTSKVKFCIFERSPCKIRRWRVKFTSQYSEQSSALPTRVLAFRFIAPFRISKPDHFRGYQSRKSRPNFALFAAPHVKLGEDGRNVCETYDRTTHSFDETLLVRLYRRESGCQKRQT